MSTQLLEFDVEQHLHPKHTANGSYPTSASVVAASSATDDRDRYTTLRTGRYSDDGDDDDCRFSLPLPKLLLAPAAACLPTIARGLGLHQEHDPMDRQPAIAN